MPTRTEEGRRETSESSGQAVFGGQIKLLGYNLVQDETSAIITLYWQALANGQIDYTRFVQLLSAEPGQPPIAQNDSYPVYNNYPTSQWTAGEIVADEVVLNVADVVTGEYQVVVGFYDGDLVRLTAVDGGGNILQNNVLGITKLKIED